MNNVQSNNPFCIFLKVDYSQKLMDYSFFCGLFDTIGYSSIYTIFS